MREILFRGKEKDDKKWYEGSYYPYTVTTYCCAEDYALHPENTRHYILFDRMTDWGLPNQHYRAEIIPETLGQYTGLNDMNDKRIFEGDIVRCKHVYEDYDGTFEDAKIRRAYGKAFDENTGECTYMRNYAVRMYNGSWELRNGSDAHKINSNYIINHDIEIIGNIHDNPELLEVGK